MNITDPEEFSQAVAQQIPDPNERARHLMIQMLAAMVTHKDMEPIARMEAGLGVKDQDPDNAASYLRANAAHLFEVANNLAKFGCYQLALADTYDAGGRIDLGT